MNELIEKINKLKKEKNAVVLAHCYQNVEIDEVADYVGDSLFLSQMAAKTNADIIVFAGVYFMAQTAKILNPNKKVLLPRLESGCRMADMITLEQLREFKSKFPKIPTVCYINSTAEVKSECDMCCTSSNAIKIVESLHADEILFLPDTYLGKWVEAQLGNVKINTYPGFCPTHVQIRPKDVENAREKGVVDRLKRDYPEKEFFLVKDSVICPNMKWNTLNDIYNALDREEHEINVDKEIASKAIACIDRMLDVSAAGAGK